MVGALIFLGVGTLLRRLLRVADGDEPRPPTSLLPLAGEWQAVYDAFAPELEVRIAMLGISLNDAFEERAAGRLDTAWRMVHLSACEWDGLENVVVGLLDTLAKHLTAAQVVVSPRSIQAHLFRSKLMVDYVRMRNLLDQLVFSSRSRYQLQLRLLRRAAEIVSGEFRRTYRQAERTAEHSAGVWNRLDLYFHDFDLIIKEALLAFRALLSSLPLSDLSHFVHELNALQRAQVHTRVTSA
jgi:hypothetical protein